MYPPHFVAGLTCSKKGEVRKFSIHELANWELFEAMLDRWNDLKLKNFVIRLENEWSRHPQDDQTSEEGSSVEDDVHESEAEEEAPPRKKGQKQQASSDLYEQLARADVTLKL